MSTKPVIYGILFLDPVQLQSHILALHQLHWSATETEFHWPFFILGQLLFIIRLSNKWRGSILYFISLWLQNFQYITPHLKHSEKLSA